MSWPAYFGITYHYKIYQHIIFRPQGLWGIGPTNNFFALGLKIINLTIVSEIKTFIVYRIKLHQTEDLEEDRRAKIAEQREARRKLREEEEKATTSAA